MTDERAIEILDPEHREYFGSIEPVEEACRSSSTDPIWIRTVITAAAWGGSDDR